MKSEVEQHPYLNTYADHKARQGHLRVGASWRILLLVAGLAGLVLLAVFLSMSGPDQSPVSPLERDTPTIVL